jgi:hypothetical protein
MRDINDSIEARASFDADDGTSFGQTSAQTPIVTVVAHVAEDVDHTEAQRVAGVLRREIANTTTFAEDANSDYTVDAFGIETISAIAVDDLTSIRDQLDRVLRNEGYTIREMAVQAEITTSSL